MMNFTPKISCIIIEDEKPAARYLMRLLQKNNLEAMAVLNSVKASMAWLAENPAPDLIFLDIQLGDGISFEIFEHFQPKSAIIFTTAFDEYALRAFKFNSIDYLLKPIQENDLVAALNKFKANTKPTHWDVFQLQSILQQNLENKYRERFLIQIGSHLKTIETEKISCFYAHEKSTYLWTEKRAYPIEQSLGELDNQLTPKDFFRISRNAIVHLKFIEKITHHSGSRYQIHMIDREETFIVSRERVQDFKIWLES